MTTFNLEFLQFNEPKRNGDRATTETDCYNFKVILNGFVAHAFTQYDSFYCHVENYDDTLREARKYADDLADTLKVGRPKLVTMVKKIVTKEEWIPA